MGKKEWNKIFVAILKVLVCCVSVTKGGGMGSRMLDVLSPVAYDTVLIKVLGYTLVVYLLAQGTYNYHINLNNKKRVKFK